MKRLASLLGFAFLMAFNAQAQQENSLLWEVKSAQGKSSFLFGTYHLVGADYLKSNSKVATAYHNSETVVVETIVDSSLMMEMAMVAMMPDRSLKELLDSADYALLTSEIMRATGYDVALFDQMKPMAILAMYTVAIAEEAMSEEALPGGQPIDLYFATHGKRQGKEVLGLETMMEQAGILYNSETVEDQARMLMQAIRDSTENKISTENLLKAYKAEDLSGMWEMANADKNDYWDMSLLLDQRNMGWIKSLKPVLDKGDSFIAVGALHLPGPEGLIELLRKQGYEVTAIK